MKRTSSEAGFRDSTRHSVGQPIDFIGVDWSYVRKVKRKSQELRLFRTRANRRWRSTDSESTELCLLQVATPRRNLVMELMSMLVTKLTLEVTNRTMEMVESLGKRINCSRRSTSDSRS